MVKNRRRHIVCPFHNEETASCCLYPATMSYYCFGCGAHGPISNLPDFDASEITQFKQKLLDRSEALSYVKEQIERILQLPVKKIRGLPLHTDGEAYYIVWPERNYYKKRFFTPKKEMPKYMCPSGVSQPLLENYQARFNESKSPLYIIEGELNALSAALATQHAIISPGGSTQFSNKEVESYLLDKQHLISEVVFVADNDGAGSKAIIDGYALLQELPLFKSTPRRHIALTQDLNDLLILKGPEAVAEVLK